VTSESKEVLTVEGLVAGYDGAPAVRDVSFEVKAGEVVALLGANGAGKTTTLRAISGIVRPMSGRITALGADAGSMAPHRIAGRGVAHVAEGRSVFFSLTVAEHFRIGHRGERLDAREAYRRFPKLEKLRDRRAGLLSGGEQQMLALARAITRRPRLLLVDELSLGLAPVIVEELLPAVRDYAIEAGAAVLIVEQHIELALDVADRGLLFNHGQLVMEGAAGDLRQDKELLIGSYLGETASD
jgi:ABC-type branched-subunit amino acid transport system ATPase component